MIRSRPVQMLPWMVAAGAFLVYALTLNHWTNLLGLPWAAKVWGWDWRPIVNSPLHYLLTLPFRVLSGTAGFIGLNLFAAVAAALTLGLLARSVMLLPQDRTREQRHRELGPHCLLTGRFSWLPPVFAAAVCGLQLTFWEHAIAETGEMLDLLIFAYVIRCLLEFRVSQKDLWFFKMAFVYGLGIANNWAMIGFFPLCLISLIWIKGLRIFDFSFLTRIILAGLLGLCLYLLLPAVYVSSNLGEGSFFQVLVENWRVQKQFLYNYPFVFYTSLRAHLFMISLTSVLPIFVVGIRWPSFHGDLSAAAHRLTDMMFRILHLMFLAICVWVFFDHKFSPRELGRALGFGIMPYLTFYYLTALCIGYFSGYFLVVFGKESANAWERSSRSMRQMHRTLVTVAGVLMILIPAGLAWKNLPIIQAGRGQWLRAYARNLVESLPAQPAVVLSDDPLRLFLVEASYAAESERRDHILVDTGALASTNYTRYLARRFRNEPLIERREKELPASLTDISFVRLMGDLARTREIYYLHPSFGYYFERFHLQPRGLAYRLAVYQGEDLVPPLPDAAELANNQNFWKRIRPPVVPASWRRELPELQLTGAYYSRALNYWAVRLQKMNRLKEADEGYANALKFNAENAVAAVNQEFNKTLQTGKPTNPAREDELEKRVSAFRGVDFAVNANGPFDQPDYCLIFGKILNDGGNVRQAGQEFLRVLELEPANAEAGLMLAKAYALMQQPQKSLDLISQIRSRTGRGALNLTNRFRLVQIEALAYLAKNDFNQAEMALQRAHENAPKDENILALMTQFYNVIGRPTNALETLEKHLAIAPDNRWALSQKGSLALLFQKQDVAIKTLDHLLQLDPENVPGLVNRAIAHLQAGHLDAAQKDYHAAEKLMTVPAFQVYYGLAEIAWRKKDKSTAAKYYKLYLKQTAREEAPGILSERKLAEERLKELQGG